MGRPPKRNLNYSTWDVDVLENDTSIDNLIDAQGPAAFMSTLPCAKKPTPPMVISTAGDMTTPHRQRASWAAG